MSDGYEVHPDALDKAGKAFEEASQQTGVHAGEFLVVAKLPDSAFGNLPTSYKLANQYQAFFGQVQTDLAALQKSLADGAGRLHLSAHNYRLAEKANTLPPTR